MRWQTVGQHDYVVLCPLSSLPFRSFSLEASDPGAFDNSRMGGRHPVLYRLALRGIALVLVFALRFLWHRRGPLGGHRARLCFGLAPWQSLSQAISVPRVPSGRAGLRRFQAQSRRPVSWIHKEHDYPRPRPASRSARHICRRFGAPRGGGLLWIPNGS